MITKHKLVILLALVLRFYRLDQAPYFADMGWFFAAASRALRSGQLPVLGITASITWLHQGPLWTYLLLLPMAISLPPQLLTVLGGVAAVALAYFAAGWLPALVLAVLPWAVTQSQLAYHTSLIPLFFFVAYLCLGRRRSFLGGLFVGWLYQLHLLTFIYWPLFFFLALKQRVKPGPAILGFAVGVLPFIIAGPVQLLGIFVWLVKQLATGFTGVSSGISTSYWVVLLPLVILFAGWMLKWIGAYSNSFGQK